MISLTEQVLRGVKRIKSGSAQPGRGGVRAGEKPGGAWIRCQGGASTQAVQGAGLELGQPPSPGFAWVLPRRETQGRGQPRAPEPRAEPRTTQLLGREAGKD